MKRDFGHHRARKATLMTPPLLLTDKRHRREVLRHNFRAIGRGALG